MAAQKEGPALAEIITLLQELSASADARLSPAAENQVRLQYRCQRMIVIMIVVIMDLICS